MTDEDRSEGGAALSGIVFGMITFLAAVWSHVHKRYLKDRENVRRSA